MEFLFKALKDLFASERGLLSLAMLVIAAVFVFVGKISTKEFFDYSQVILGIYVAGKSISSVGVSMAASKAVPGSVRDHRPIVPAVPVVPEVK